MKTFVNELIIFCSLIMLFAGNVHAQKETIIIPPVLSKNTLDARTHHKKNFDKAVVFLNNNQLDSAHIYFTIAIRYYEYADAYYNRGVTNLRKGNKNGFCKDMKMAGKLGDLDADSLYCLKCIKRDTTYYDSLGNIASAELSTMLVSREISKYDSSIIADTINRNSDGFYVLRLYDRLNVKCKNPSIVLPSYNAGKRSLFKSNLYKSAPEHITDGRESVKVECSFGIDENGNIKNIKYISGNKKFYEIVKKRLLGLSKWTPATLNGKYEDVEIEFFLMTYSRKIIIENR